MVATIRLAYNKHFDYERSFVHPATMRLLSERGYDWKREASLTSSGNGKKPDFQAVHKTTGEKLIVECKRDRSGMTDSIRQIIEYRELANGIAVALAIPFGEMKPRQHRQCQAADIQVFEVEPLSHWGWLFWEHEHAGKSIFTDDKLRVSRRQPAYEEVIIDLTTILNEPLKSFLLCLLNQYGRRFDVSAHIQTLLPHFHDNDLLRWMYENKVQCVYDSRRRSDFYFVSN